MLTICKRKHSAVFSANFSAVCPAHGSSPSADSARRQKKTAAAVTEEVIGEPVSFKSGSTDCNIPLSLGIPALCFGVYNGKGCHTRNEYVEKASLLPGLEIGIKAMIKLCAL